MKKGKNNIKLLMAAVLGALVALTPFSANSQTSKEVDDLYFSKNDRVKIKYATNEDGDRVTESQATYESYSNNNYTPRYSAKTVNPEYIAKYKSASRQSVQEELDAQSQLDAQENANYSSEDYYVEGYDNGGYTTSGASTVNIYYGGGWNMWNPYANFYYNSWNSPFWSPGWGFSVGYSWGWGGFGWNNWNMWNSPWGFYDPWYGGWGGYYGYGWGWRRPYYGWGNSWAYYNGFYDGYYSGKGLVVNRRDVVRGGRVNRSAAIGSGYAGTSGASRYRNANVTNVTGSADRSGSSRGRTVSSSTNSRDYSRTQNEYFQRSRVGYSSGVGTSDRNTNAVTGRSSGRDAYESTVRSRNAYSVDRSANTGSTSRGESNTSSYSRGSAAQDNSRNISSPSSGRSSGSTEFRGATPSSDRVYQGQSGRQVAPSNNSYRSRSGNSYSSPSYSQPSNRGSYSSPSYNRSSGSTGGSRSSSGFSAPSRSSGSGFSAPSRSSGSSFSAPSRSSGSSSGSFSAPSRSSSSGSSGGRSSGSSSSGGSRRGGN